MFNWSKPTTTGGNSGNTTGQTFNFGQGGQTSTTTGVGTSSTGTVGGMFGFAKPGGSTMGGTSGIGGTTGTTGSAGGLGSSSTPSFGAGATGSFFNQPTGGQQTSTTGGGLFGSKPTTTTTTGLGMFTSASSGGGLFNKPSGQPTGSTTGMTATSNIGTTNFPNLMQQRTQVTPTLTLPPTNYLKYEKVESLNDDIKNIIKQIEATFRKNEIYLEQSEGLIKDLYENYKLLSSDGVKVVKYCKLINSKKSKVDFILKNAKGEIEHQNDQVERTRKNFHILKEHPNMKIMVPSDYFIELMKEIEDKISLQILQISDLEALANLYYRKEYGSFKINSDLVEETIKSIYNCLLNLVSEAAKLNEYVAILKSNYVEMMKVCYGWKEYEVENRMRQMISSLDEEKEKLIQRETKQMNFY